MGVGRYLELHLADAVQKVHDGQVQRLAVPQVELQAGAVDGAQSVAEKPGTEPAIVQGAPRGHAP